MQQLINLVKKNTLFNSFIFSLSLIVSIIYILYRNYNLLWILSGLFLYWAIFCLVRLREAPKISWEKVTKMEVNIRIGWPKSWLDKWNNLSELERTRAMLKDRYRSALLKLLLYSFILLLLRGYSFMGWPIWVAEGICGAYGLAQLVRSLVGIIRYRKWKNSLLFTSEEEMDGTDVNMSRLKYFSQQLDTDLRNLESEEIDVQI